MTRPQAPSNPNSTKAWIPALGLALALVACGGGGSGSSSPAAPGSPSMSLLAGALGGPGWVDAMGTQARFDRPSKAVADAAGVLYVADTSNHVIRKVLPTGQVITISGKAGERGRVDGPASTARFDSPIGLALDGSGDLFITELGNYAVRRMDPSGAVSTYAGNMAESATADGSASVARFKGPRDLVFDASGNLYVSDRDSHNIRKITPRGLVSTFAGATDGSSGSTDGLGTAARLNAPHGLAYSTMLKTVGDSGRIFVADTLNHTLRMIDADGNVATLAGQAGSPGKADGQGSNARFNGPQGIAVDAQGLVYVADSDSHTLRAVKGTSVTTVAGLALQADYVEGPGGTARFSHPVFLSWVSGRGLVIADELNHAIRLLQYSDAGFTASTLAGSGVRTGLQDGAGDQARFNTPWDVAGLPGGGGFVVDTNNHTLRMVTAGGTVSTLAGAPGLSGSDDGAGSSARFAFPIALVIEGKQSAVIVDLGNNALRRVYPEDGAVITLAGSASGPGSQDGQGSAARFRTPRGIARDGAGNLYVADMGNHTIRKVTATGAVTTLAGLAGKPGATNGSGPAARFHYPSAVALDGQGNVYVADSGNHLIRKITPAGEVTTLAGKAETTGYVNGRGGDARFNEPARIIFDGQDALIVADKHNQALRKVKLDGTTTTLAGQPGPTGVVLGASPRFSAPTGLTLLPEDPKTLFVTDTEEHAILKILLP